jgi:hypothetical protein
MTQYIGIESNKLVSKDFHCTLRVAYHTTVLT